MAALLNAEEKTEYTRIIDGILATADLNTVSRKKVREALETTIDRDLSAQKYAIKSLIEARFDAISNNAIPTPPPVNGRASSGSDEQDLLDEEFDDDIDDRPPASKKTKREKLKREAADEEEDARLAAELQAQENRLARGRTTRGGASATSKVTKKTKSAKPAKKKSAKRVRSDDDDDDGSGADDAKEKRKASGGFQKPFVLSDQLADLVGAPQMSRPQVVKKIWEHIKANELQDPRDKRQIQCDDKMQAVFKVSRVDMFSMNKHLGNHLFPIEEE